MPVKTKQRLQKEYRWHPPRAVITVQGSGAGSKQARSAPSCMRGGGCHRQPWGAGTPGAHGLQELTSPGGTHGGLQLRRARWLCLLLSVHLELLLLCWDGGTEGHVWG